MRGGFWIRELGLYDDEGVLIAVANCPETYKPLLQEGSGRTQTFRMILIVSATSAITLKIDPAVVLATRQYVDNKVIEVKAYADDLMTKHLAAANPHPKYAPIASPTFTGKPKAPTPPLVANDAQIATAEFVQSLIAALVSGELANKQPLDKTLTDLSGKNAAAILEYLGLGDFGTAAGKNVGTGAGEIPDMSAWAHGGNDTNGWKRSPDGYIEQWGTGIYSNEQVINLSIPFPNAFLGVFINADPYHTTHVESSNAWPYTAGSFRVSVSVINSSGVFPSTLSCCWRAYGR